MSRLERKVHWWPSGNPSRPWGAVFEGQQWELSVTGVPGRRRYVLLVDGRQEDEFEDWPANWTTAPDDGANASQRTEFDHERERFEKNRDVPPLDDRDLEPD